MKLYHGSDVLVSQPDLMKGKPFKDFGRGFYLSDTFEQAKAMDDRVAARSSLGIPSVVSTFEFDESAMTELQYPQGVTFQYFFGSEAALQKLTFIC